ncbi:MAG: tyrosine-type recombinase/integrase [Acidobacteria bacterium]|nr:tyrosine-type recombinase/integrase [Acidobacteriota bacterium]
MSERRPKGTGNIRERGGRFQATYSYMDATGRRRLRSETFDTKTEARAWLTARLAEVATGRVSDPGTLTVGEYLQDWLGSLGMAQLEAATVSWYRSAVIRHIIPALGGVKLSKLSAIQVEAFLAEKAENGRLDGKGGLGPVSVRRLHVTLRKALAAAVRKGMLATNPVDLADKPKIPPVDVTESCWTPEHMTAFLEATKADRLAPLWRTACMTGLRRSELCGLQWPDIDLDAGVLSVKRAMVQVDGKPILKGPKSASSRRAVDFDAGTVAVLRRWKVSQLEERLLAGTAWEQGDWVFTNEIGAPWRPDSLTKTFLKTARATELPRTDVRGLRHAHATAMLRAGVHPKVVQERLGHSSIAVTMDIYSSVLPGMQREAIDRLASMMEPGRGPIDGG